MARVKPLVSVLVPTYNGARFLDETLLSIRRQTHRNLEIIIRDDASTDDSVRIAQQNAAEDSRIRVERASVNAGGIENYIALAKSAGGGYLKYCNQDDLLDPTCVETLLGALDRHPNVTLATSTRRLVDADGAPLPDRPYTAALVDRDTVIPGREVLRHLALSHLNQVGEPTTALYRNGCVDPETMFHFGGRHADVNCDVFLWAQLLTSGDLYFHRQPLSSFRIHDGQFSANDVTFVNGHIEWAYLLESAIEAGVVDRRDPACAQSARNLLVAFETVAHRARVSPDSRVHASEGRIAAAAVTLRNLIDPELRSA